MASQGARSTHTYESSFCGAEMQNVPRNYRTNFYHGCTYEGTLNKLRIVFAFLVLCPVQKSMSRLEGESLTYVVGIY